MLASYECPLMILARHLELGGGTCLRVSVTEQGTVHLLIDRYEHTSVECVNVRNDGHSLAERATTRIIITNLLIVQNVWIDVDATILPSRTRLDCGFEDILANSCMRVRTTGRHGNKAAGLGLELARPRQWIRCACAKSFQDPSPWRCS